MDSLQKSIQYFCDLSQDERTLIHHYTCEIDPDDWTSCRLSISYQVINYILKQCYVPPSKLGYVPDLIAENVLSVEDMHKQVKSAQHLKVILDRFPYTNKDTIVCKGMLSDDVFFKQSSGLSVGTDITVPYFLSTSIHFDVASRFTARTAQKCYWVITVPSGFPLPFIRKDTGEGHEGEILLNIGAILRVNSKHITHDNHIISLTLIGFSKSVETRSFWDKIQTIACTYAHA